MARIDPERIREQIEIRSVEIRNGVIGDQKEAEYRKKCAEQIFLLLKNQTALEALLRYDELSAQYVSIQLFQGVRDDAPRMNRNENLNLVIDRADGPGKRKVTLRCRQTIGSVNMLFRKISNRPDGVEAIKKWADKTFGVRYPNVEVTPWSSDRNDYSMEIEGFIWNSDELLLAYGSKIESILMKIYRLFYPTEEVPAAKEPPLDLLGEES